MESPSFEEWLEEVCKRPLPLNPMEQLEILAMELAEGSVLGYWGIDLINHQENKKKYLSSISINEDEFFASFDGLQSELIKKHGFSINQKHALSLFVTYGLVELKSKYITQTTRSSDKSGSITSRYEIKFARLSKLAFDLMKQKSSGEKKITLFISYRRKESSAFALLLLSLLKSNQFDPFLDLAIKPGENWHSTLEDYIKNRDYFIVLLGPTTLQSSITIQEIEWAIQYGRIVIPIWHNGFEFKPSDWDLPDEVSKVLGTTHTIRITEESALAYHSAVLELLNHFGITPTL